MLAYVITILNNEKSVQAAKRCIKSAAKNGLEVDMWKATTPKDFPIEKLIDKGIPTTPFDEIYSRTQNCAAAFCSHMSLWERSIEYNEPVVIFEHDAVVHDKVPTDVPFDKVMTFSKPSYGKFNTPSIIGVNPLTQKRYFGGAHGYIVKPQGAVELIEQAKTMPRPADLFLSLDFFPWLQEYYPWVCTAMDDFSTIQNMNGIQAKHRYGETYGIEEV
jgi:GR25 family glycosyltransferase involved in LPS biosynthesis